MQKSTFKIQVGSEIGTLRSLIIHSPDSGIGRVAPSQAQDWLFEDIIHLDTVRKEEYDLYVKILMYFLDPEKIKGKLAEIDSPENERAFFNPGKAGFHASSKVIEFEKLLADILAQPDIKNSLTASVCAIEGCNYKIQQELIHTEPLELAKTLISGSRFVGEMLFPPIPNLIFTRDIGIAINNFILINKPAKAARARETLLARYIFFNHPVFENHQNILEIPDKLQDFLRPGEEHGEKTTIEGGDVMVVSPDHVLIGCTERTSASGASEAIKLLFERKVVKKVTVVKIPPKRDFMHIDTVFTQINRNTWVVLGSMSSQKPDKESEVVDYISEKRKKEKPEILQFEIDNINEPKSFNCIEALLDDISKNDLKSTERTQFIYSGNNVFPFDVREQWTDSCNLLALKEGVVVGYERNDKTVEAFKEKGFNIITAADLITRLESGESSAEHIENTLILMPSAELSRARGGFHCMSMPLFREKLEPIFPGEKLTNGPASTIMMIRPVNFAFNEQTAGSNAFQDERNKELKVQKKALKEFDDFVTILRENHINVLVFEDNPEPHTPDSIFPNNWISTHSDGKIFIYPMKASNRRFEKRPDIIEELRMKYKIDTEVDLSYLESEGKFLEGTGSMVLDRVKKIAYACISPRTDEKALKLFSDLSGYKPIVFHAFDKKGKAIYHTNVMMCIGETFAVICLESITDNKEKNQLVKSLQASGKKIIDISFEQMYKFAGNMLQLKNTKGDSLLVMSEQARNSLSPQQVEELEQYSKIIASPLNTIESSGGGSARCMIAEIYLAMK